ncbi:MAG: hypothetical protein WCQ49_02200 [Candidatus Saccharibacteria bacterium]
MLNCLNDDEETRNKCFGAIKDNAEILKQNWVELVKYSESNETLCIRRTSEKAKVKIDSILNNLESYSQAIGSFVGLKKELCSLIRDYKQLKVVVAKWKRIGLPFKKFNKP